MHHSYLPLGGGESPPQETLEPQSNEAINDARAEPRGHPLGGPRQLAVDANSPQPSYINPQLMQRKLKSQAEAEAEVEARGDFSGQQGPYLPLEFIAGCVAALISP